MSITKDDIKYIANIAKLEFDEEEAEIFAYEFENILQQLKSLEKINLEDIEIKKTKTSIVRKDILKKYNVDKLYINSKNMRETFIEVPKIID